jgi:hypothetical protein
MFTTTVAVIPKRIRSALDDVLDYVTPAEADDYRAAPKELRKWHIYRKLQIIFQWLWTVRGEPDTLAIQNALEAHGYLVSFWHVDDVKGLRPDLTDKQCRKVLQHAGRKLDAEIGINWDVLRCHADELFPESGAV